MTSEKTNIGKEAKYTGRSRYRVNDNGNLLLQIEVYITWFDHYWKGRYIWRDARVEDLTLNLPNNLKDYIYWE